MLFCRLGAEPSLKGEDCVAVGGVTSTRIFLHFSAICEACPSASSEPEFEATTSLSRKVCAE